VRERYIESIVPIAVDLAKGQDEFTQRTGISRFMTEEKMQEFEEFMKTLNRKEYPIIHSKFEYLKENLDKMPFSLEDRVKMAQQDPERFLKNFDEYDHAKSLFDYARREKYDEWWFAKNKERIENSRRNFLKEIRGEAPAEISQLQTLPNMANLNSNTPNPFNR